LSFIQTRGWVAIAGATWLLAACSLPVAVSNNWELISRDVAAKTQSALPNNAVHVAAPHNSSVFDFAFREFLVAELVKNGATVLQQPSPDGAEVTYNAQVIRHNGAGPHFISSTPIMLAEGVAVAHDVAHPHIDGNYLSAQGLMDVTDDVNSIQSGGGASTEVILTTIISQDGKMLSRSTDVYYLQNTDTPLFLRPQYYRDINMKVVSQ